jgi:hypothetical protein
VAAGLGVGAIVGGAFVLCSNNATNVGVDPFVTAPEPSASFMYSFTAWNGTRATGGALVVLGLAIVLTAIGILLGRRGGLGLSRRTLAVAWGVSAAVFIGALIAFAYCPSPEASYVGTYRLLRAPAGDLPPVVLATTVWSDGQAVCALVATAGLLLLSWATGLALGRRSQPNAQKVSEGW